MTAKILLTDDHRMMREGLRSLISKQPGLEVVGEADNGRAAIQLARKLKPDLIIMDINMPDLNGIDAATQIIGEFPGIRIIGLSMFSDKRFVNGMLKAGVSGYLLKDCAFEELATAIKSVIAGQIYISPRVAGTIVKDYVERISEQDAASSDHLSTREREVLQLIAEGKKTKDIATKLNISVKTVETHRQQIMRKLNTFSVAELTKIAIREGLTDLGE